MSKLGCVHGTPFRDLTVAGVMRVRIIVLATLAIALGAAAGSAQQVVKATGNRPKAHDGELSEIAISADGRVLASCGDDKMVRLWSLPQGDLLRTLSGHKKLITSLAFSPDGRLLAAASEDQTVSLWSVADGQRVGTLAGHADWVEGVRITPDGSHVLTQAGNELRIWSLPDGKLVRTTPLSMHSAELERAAMTPDGRTLAMAPRFGGMVTVWSLPDLQPLPVPESLAGTGTLAVVPPDGASLVLAGKQTLSLWWLAEGRVVSLAGDVRPIVDTLAVAPDGRSVAAGDYDDGVRAWSLPDGRPLFAVAHGDPGSVRALAFSPDGRLVVSGGSDSSVKLWSLPDGALVATLEGHRGLVGLMQVTPDGSMLITGQQSNYRLTSPTTMRKEKADAVIALWTLNPPAFRRYLAK